MSSHAPISTFRPAVRWILPAILLLVAVTGAALAAPAATAADDGAASLRLEQVLSSPFPSQMTAAPTGGHVAWVFNHQGVRNIWVASPPDYRGRALTRFTADDGQELGNLTFDSTGRRIAYVRGGGPNSKGELPNPLSDPAGVERALWVLDIAGGESVRVAEGTQPLFRSNGDLLFVDKGKLWTASFPAALTERRKKQTAAPKTERLIDARGGMSNLRLSPDGQRLAFVSDRGRHSLIGLYDFGPRSLRFLVPSVDRDSSPVFSPDGAAIAFVRQPARAAQTIFEPQRAGQPWSIWVVELETGDGRIEFQADPANGSVFHELEADDQIVWTQSDRIILPWERDGWLHLYAVSLGPGPRNARPRLLTPGFFEVEYVAARADRRGLVFSSNQDDIDRRHLWLLADGSDHPQALTSGDGIEQTPVPIPGSNAVAFLRATGTRPLQPAIRLDDGSIRDLAPDALKDFPLAAMVTPEQVIFPASDGMKIHGQLFLPAAGATGRRPAVIFFHGGSRRHMMLGWHYSSYYHNCYAFHQYMASQGYVVLSVNYRSGTGYGLQFREAENYGATGASELNDVLGAGLYLQGRDDVDPDRIGLWGGSYGGYLTAMGLSHASDLFAAGVDIHGVHDWNKTIKNFIPSYDPLADPARTRLAFESSPMAAVDGWRSPVLLIHGDDDRNVPFTETVDLVEQLRARGVEHEILVFPDEIHGFLTYRRWLEVFEHAAAFFERHIGVAKQRQETRAVVGG